MSQEQQEAQKQYLASIIMSNSQQIQKENTTQYYTICKDCNESFIRDVGHICKYWSGKVNMKK